MPIVIDFVLFHSSFLSCLQLRFVVCIMNEDYILYDVLRLLTTVG